MAGNQHWGHATSRDLYTWENQKIAIYPGAEGEGIFSGSAVIDVNNTSGFFPNQTNGVVAMYTLNTAQEEVQDIAYSTDGGYTFTKYASNPVISINSTQFRDPKVLWYAPTKSWVAVISYAQDFVIGIFTSPNLTNWTHASNFSHAGLLGLQYECPNLVSLPMLKNASLAEPLDPANFASTDEMYILQISINPGAPQGGSISQYFPGTFNGTHFTTADAATRLTDFGKDNYAGQFFYNIPATSPQISIAWASNWEYAQLVPTGVRTFRSRSFPFGSEIELQDIFGSKRTFLVPRLVSQLHHLPRISIADAEICAASRRFPLFHDNPASQRARKHNTFRIHPPLLPLSLLFSLHNTNSPSQLVHPRQHLDPL